MRDSVPSARYSSVCNVLRLWRICSSLLIETTDSMISPVFKSQHHAYDTEKGRFFLARFKAKMW